MGNGQWAVGIKKIQERNARSNIIPSMPHARCERALVSKKDKLAK